MAAATPLETPSSAPPPPPPPTAPAPPPQPAPLRPWLAHAPLRRLRVYASRHRVYVVGHDAAAGGFRVLKLARQDLSSGAPPRLEAVSTAGGASAAAVLTREQVEQALRRVHESTPGGLALVARAHGIVGCYRLTEGYALLLVTRRQFVGALAGGHRVYRVADTASVPLTMTTGSSSSSSESSGAFASPGSASGGLWSAWLGGGGGGGAAGDGGGAAAAAAAAAAGGSSGSAAERRYRKLLAGVDLTRGFYFSYTYCLARTMQRNHHHEEGGQGGGEEEEGDGDTNTANANANANANHPTENNPPNYDVWSSMFVWNAHLTHPLRDCLASTSSLSGGGGWLLPLIHGWWEQRRLSLLGRPVTLTLLSRRSRHFAGTRYRKRGINDEGRVANEVETEQIVDAGTDWATGGPLLSSVVQLRGSVPLFWNQAASAMSPKPDVVVQQFDPLYDATRRHFLGLLKRYGAPVVALDLLRSAERRPRETLLRAEYARAVAAVGASLAAENERSVTQAKGRTEQEGEEEGRRREGEAGGGGSGAAAAPPPDHPPPPPNPQVDLERLVVHVPWDFQLRAKRPGANILDELAPVLQAALDDTGFYLHQPRCCSSCAPQCARRLLPFAARAQEDARREAAYRREAHVLTRGDGEGEGEGGAGGGGAADSLLLRPPILRARTHRHRSLDPRPRLQRGVLRTNCVDCLDRTNVAQFAFGLFALGRQLHALGIAGGGTAAEAAGAMAAGAFSSSSVAGGVGGDGELEDDDEYAGCYGSSSSSSEGEEDDDDGNENKDGERGRTPPPPPPPPTRPAHVACPPPSWGLIDPDSPLALQLAELYEAMGHELALQYGGSEAHATYFDRRLRRASGAAAQSRDLLTSIRRYYSNAYTDAEKQDAINLFLGNYVPHWGGGGTGGWGPVGAAGAAAAGSAGGVGGASSSMLTPAPPPSQLAIWELDSDYYLHSGPWNTYGRLLREQQAAALAAAGGNGGGGGNAESSDTVPVRSSSGVVVGHLPASRARAAGWTPAAAGTFGFAGGVGAAGPAAALPPPSSSSTTTTNLSTARVGFSRSRGGPSSFDRPMSPEPLPGYGATVAAAAAALAAATATTPTEQQQEEQQPAAASFPPTPFARRPLLPPTLEGIVEALARDGPSAVAAAAEAAERARRGDNNSPAPPFGGTPLLPMTASDGIALDSAEDPPPAAEAGGFDFRALLAGAGGGGGRAGAAGGGGRGAAAATGGGPTAAGASSSTSSSAAAAAARAAAASGVWVLDTAPEPRSALVSFDAALAAAPPLRATRLYPGDDAGPRRSLVWDAVSQAFTLFGGGGGGGAAAGAGGGSAASSAAGDNTPRKGRGGGAAPSALALPRGSGVREEDDDDEDDDDGRSTPAASPAPASRAGSGPPPPPLAALPPSAVSGGGVLSRVAALFGGGGSGGGSAAAAAAVASSVASPRVTGSSAPFGSKQQQPAPQQLIMPPSSAALPADALGVAGAAAAATATTPVAALPAEQQPSPSPAPPPPAVAARSGRIEGFGYGPGGSFGPGGFGFGAGFDASAAAAASRAGRSGGASATTTPGRLDTALDALAWRNAVAVRAGSAGGAGPGGIAARPEPPALTDILQVASPGAAAAAAAAGVGGFGGGFGGAAAASPDAQLRQRQMAVADAAAARAARLSHAGSAHFVDSDEGMSSSTTTTTDEEEDGEDDDDEAAAAAAALEEEDDNDDFGFDARRLDADAEAARRAAEAASWAVGGAAADGARQQQAAADGAAVVVGGGNDSSLIARSYADLASAPLAFTPLALALGSGTGAEPASLRDRDGEAAADAAVAAAAAAADATATTPSSSSPYVSSAQVAFLTLRAWRVAVPLPSRRAQRRRARLWRRRRRRWARRWQQTGAMPPLSPTTASLLSSPSWRQADRAAADAEAAEAEALRLRRAERHRAAVLAGLGLSREQAALWGGGGAALPSGAEALAAAHLGVSLAYQAYERALGRMLDEEACLRPLREYYLDVTGTRAVRVGRGGWLTKGQRRRRRRREEAGAATAATAAAGR